MVGEAWANQQVIGVSLQLISLASLGFTSLLVWLPFSLVVPSCYQLGLVVEYTNTAALDSSVFGCRNFYFSTEIASRAILPHDL